MIAATSNPYPPQKKKIQWRSKYTNFTKSNNNNLHLHHSHHLRAFPFDSTGQRPTHFEEEQFFFFWQTFTRVLLDLNQVSGRNADWRKSVTWNVDLNELQAAVAGIRRSSTGFVGKQSTIYMIYQRSCVPTQLLSSLFALCCLVGTRICYCATVAGEGMVVRSKVKWLPEGEKVTKHFCGSENRNFQIT